MMRKAVTTLALLAGALAGSVAGSRSWMNLGDTPAQRAAKLLANMNIDEKITMVRPHYQVL